MNNLKDYYISQGDRLLGYGNCQPGNEDKIETYGGELHWGKPPESLKPMSELTPWHTFDPKNRTWVLPLSAAWTRVRAERDRRLAETDWTALPDVPFSPEQLQAWQKYRQQLRDITLQKDPLKISWPVPPRG